MASVREIMTADPEQVDADAQVHEAALVMRELNVGAVPVTSGGQVCGIITDRDITLRVLAENRNPAEVKVRDVATSSIVTTAPDTDVADAARLMAEHQVRRLPVVEGGRLVGMLSLADVSLDGNARVAGTALKEISSPAEPDR